MSAQSREHTLTGAAYLDLQCQVREEGLFTAKLLQLYALEGFPACLAARPVRDHFRT
ncbi:hypothetical protein MLPF_2585 [Mycobacterium lepromatosis]|nr:hypothetical protein MLPF_2585 [Mycobacterium lepromatosis]